MLMLVPFAADFPGVHWEECRGQFDSMAHRVPFPQRIRKAPLRSPWAEEQWGARSVAPFKGSCVRFPRGPGPPRASAKKLFRPSDIFVGTDAKR